MKFLGLSFRTLFGVDGGDSERRDFDDRALLRAAVPVPPLFRINPFIFYNVSKTKSKNVKNCNRTRCCAQITFLKLSNLT